MTLSVMGIGRGLIAVFMGPRITVPISRLVSEAISASRLVFLSAIIARHSGSQKKVSGQEAI